LGISWTVLPRLAWNRNSPNLSLLCRWDTNICHHIQLLVEMGCCELFAWAGFQLWSS
jgi:hypothetical protein